MKKFAYLVLLLVIAMSQSAWSAATTTTPSMDPELAKAKEFIEKKDWSNAIQTLESYTRGNPSNADGFNLLGYGYRNLKRFDESLVAYEKALKLDPQHRGAHEYIGETYLKVGKLAEAEKHLATLREICPAGCEELTDLEKAIAAYKKT
jgi:cytochrome c-type biogenesis protein CcmH/NrfG